MKGFIQIQASNGHIAIIRIVAIKAITQGSNGTIIWWGGTAASVLTDITPSQVCALIESNQ